MLLLQNKGHKAHIREKHKSFDPKVSAFQVMPKSGIEEHQALVLQVVEVAQKDAITPVDHGSGH